MYFDVPLPKNEPIYAYAPGSEERKALKAALEELFNQEPIEIPVIVGGKEIFT